MADRLVEVVVAMAGEDVLAGRLISRWGKGAETSSFAYDSTYLARPDAYSLDPILPLMDGYAPAPVGLAIFRAFADAAPDTWGRNLIKRAEMRRAKDAGATARSLSEIDFLLGVRDDFRQGALRFKDPDSGSFLAPDDTDVPRIIGLPKLLRASERLEADSETAEDLADLLRAGSSLGGARPKAHVVDAQGNLSIAKFPSTQRESWDVPAWEKVTLDLAATAGIEVADSELLRIDGRSILVVRRFDRARSRRIGYVSAMTMLESADGESGNYLEIAEVLERYSPQATVDMQQLWKRIAFSILVSNTDDHLRNHGFLHANGGAWRLSPAFDLNPNPDPGPKHLRTSIDGSDPAASIDLLMSVTSFFRLTGDQALGLLSEVSLTTDSWRQVASNHGIPRGEIEEMSAAFEHSETQAARALVT